MALASFLVWAAFNGAPKPAEVKLPDGRVIQLAGISTGATHQLPQTWRTRLSLFAPAALKRVLGPSFEGSFGFGSDGLAAWLMCYDPAAGGFASGWIGKCVAIDEHGCEFPSKGLGATGDGYFFSQVVHFGVYPRRQETFICRMFDAQGHPMADWTIRNPKVSETPEWIPEKLPLHLTNGPLVLLLEGFEGSAAAARFKVLRAGLVEEFWAADDVAFEDASGNRGPALCRHEKAWQWTGTFHRKFSAPFAPAEMTTITNVTIPAAGSVAAHSVTSQIGSVWVTNVSVAGPGRYDWSNGVLIASTPYAPGMGSSHGSSSGGAPNPWKSNWKESDRSFIMLPDLDIPQDAKLILRVRQESSILGVAEMGGSANETHFYELPPEIPAGTVDLDFIVDPGFVFKARIAPSEISEPRTQAR